MTEGKRPGGLTAMAVFNFIFAGMGVLGVLGMAVMIWALGMENLEETEVREFKQAMEEAGDFHTVAFMIALPIVSTVLLLLSGIGYLKQKRFLGRALGNAWALLDLARISAMLNLMPPIMGGEFQLGTIIGLIYPILTLLMLNLVLKEDFIR